MDDELTMDVIVKFLLQQEPRLQTVIDDVGILDLNYYYKSPFVALISAIIGQYLPYKQAKIVRSKLYIRCGSISFTPKTLLRIDFQNIGLNLTVKQLILTVTQTIIDQQLDLNQAGIWGQLNDISGITQPMIIIAQLTCFANWDLFPYTDICLKQRLQKLYQLRNIPSDKRTLELTAKFSPYRTVVTWYLWRWM